MVNQNIVVNPDDRTNYTYFFLVQINPVKKYTAIIRDAIVDAVIP